jgi:protein-serine/threonine kinase
MSRPSTSQGKHSMSSTRSTDGTGALSPRDLNPAISPKAEPAPPTVSQTQVHHPHGQSSPSVVTVDAISTKQAAAAKENKSASSGPARKVMNWFRRKSIAKETLSSINTSHLRSDSTTSFVRVSESPARPSQTATQRSNIAMSSTTSVAKTAEPIPAAPAPIVETSPVTVPEPSKPVEVETVKAVPETATKEVKEVVPKPAKSGGLMLPPGAGSSASSVPRSMSHQPPPATAPIPSTAVFGQQRPVTRPTTASRSDDSKMRVHAGLVDQSALSSNPPKEVMEEVLKILHDMGIDVRRENEYRFRCTRVRKKKAGATTGLGLGSVMSVGSGMGSFSLMGNASTSRVCILLIR